MKLSSMLFKVFISNYKQIRLFSVCNILSTTIVFLFISISTNDSFMNPSVVNPMISNNIYLPLAVILIFAAFFVPYSLQAFLKLQRYNFGVLTTLGMKTIHLYALQMAECFCIVAFSVISGAFIGTILHIIIFVSLSSIFHIDFNFYPDLDSYKIVIPFYLFLSIAGLCINFILHYKDRINQWIYGMEKKKNVPLTNFIRYICIIIGMSTIIISMVILKFYNEEKNDLWLYSMLLCLIGFYLVLSGAGIFLRTIQKKIKKTTSYFLISIIDFNYKEFKKVIFMAVILIQFSVFFICLSDSVHKLMLRNAISYTPFHLQYVEMNGYNIEGEEFIKSLCNKSDIKIEEFEQLEFLRNSFVNIYDESDINKISDKEFKIEPGKFVVLYQYDLKDGYAHEPFPVRELTIKGIENSHMSFECSGEEVNILFNKNRAFADWNIVVNDLDYEKLKEIIPQSLQGKIMMYRFKDWKNAEPIIQEITNYFNENNKIDNSEDMIFYSISSRIQDVNTANESGYFLMILSMVILCMFCMAENIILYYSQRINIDKTKEIYEKLYFVGMKRKNIIKLEYIKNCVIFISPGLFSIFIAIIYSYRVNKLYLRGSSAALLAGCLTMIIMFIQFAVANLYTKKNILSEIG